MKEIDLRKPGLHLAMKEVDTMMKLPPHRNVVQLHEHWKSADGKDMWLLLEYCSIGTLAMNILESARLNDAALWDLSGQLLQALHLFEQHRIVHNDIKPENIFLMEGGIPKIGDLGMARFTSVGSVLTKMPGGTPLFQSPEALSKEIGPNGKPLCFSEYAECEVSYQSDVYSLGAVLWSMVMRRNPDHPGGAFPLTPALVPDSRLRELVNDMLQPDPAKRPRASHLVLRFTSHATAPALAIGSTETLLPKVHAASCRPLLTALNPKPQYANEPSKHHALIDFSNPQQAAQPQPQPLSVNVNEATGQIQWRLIVPLVLAIVTFACAGAARWFQGDIFFSIFGVAFVVIIGAMGVMILCYTPSSSSSSLWW